MSKALKDQVVVITGASSGIGRATAVELGRRGASVVLAARGEQALKDAAREVEEAGGRAHLVVTDVAEWGQVERLAREAVEHFGRIDTWVNNAAVSEYAAVAQTEPEEAEQIVRINLLGQIYGCRAALDVMQRQGEGTIVNVSSVEAWLGVPYTAVYSATKHGVKGFTEALRRELISEGSPVRVTQILPSSINTPLFEHARSKLGAEPMPLPPAYPPEEVALAIADACENPRRDVVVGGAGKAFDLLERLSPALLDLVLGWARMGKKGQVSDRPATKGDNLFSPSDGPSRAEGSYGDVTLSSSTYTRTFELHPALKGLLLGAAVAGGVALLRGLSRPSGRRSD